MHIISYRSNYNSTLLDVENRQKIILFNSLTVQKLQNSNDLINYYRIDTNCFIMSTIRLKLLTLRNNVDIIGTRKSMFTEAFMENIQNLCMGCMNELEGDGTCSYCNYNADSPYLQSYLPPKSMLDNDRYIVGKVLSYNGEGASYIGYDTMTSSKVVIHEYMPDKLCSRTKQSPKVMVKTDSLNKYKTYMSEYAELNKSLSRMRTLSHLVPAIDMFAENNTMYAISKYVEGITLKKFLQGNGDRLSWEQIKKIFPPIFTTLSLIHNSGIIHGGICPDNIIVTPKGELKLIGFSISAARVENSDLSSELYPGYAAPEQYNSMDWLGTWTDVYAIAAVLYRMLTGVLPPNAFSRKQADNIIDLSQMSIDIPQNVSRVIMQALRVNPETRVQTITELVTKLFEQPEYVVEHKKGATQTIHVDTDDRIRNSYIEDEEDEPEEEEAEKRNLVPTVVGSVVLALLVGVGLFFLAQMFTGGGDNSSFNTVSGNITSVTVTAETTVSDSSDASSDSSSKIDYGTGAVMPDLKGLEYENVIESIENDFNIVIKEKKSKKYGEGIIIKQSIPADAEYDPARKNTLKLTISTGSGDASSDYESSDDSYTDSASDSSYTDNPVIPDFSGYTSTSYGEVLSKLGITYAFSFVESDSVPSGNVIATSTAVGQEFDTTTGDVLTVTVAQ